jgi:hypothetical protein
VPRRFERLAPDLERIALKLDMLRAVTDGASRLR